MADKSEVLYQRVLDALSNLHADRSVSLSTAITNFKAIQDECDTYIDALEGDLAVQEAAALEDDDG
jgi:hypothetical protein